MEKPSKLKGTLASDAQENSQLKGTLINKDSEKGEPKLAVGVEITQRDSGKVFTIDAIRSARNGEVVNLIGPSGETITLNKAELEEKLNTPDGAWNY